MSSTVKFYFFLSAIKKQIFLQQISLPHKGYLFYKNFNSEQTCGTIHTLKKIFYLGDFKFDFGHYLFKTCIDSTLLI